MTTKKITTNYQIQKIEPKERTWGPVYESCDFSPNKDGCFEDSDHAIQILDKKIVKMKGCKFRVVKVTIEERIKVEEIMAI